MPLTIRFLETNDWERPYGVSSSKAGVSAPFVKTVSATRSPNGCWATRRSAGRHDFSNQGSWPPIGYCHLTHSGVITTFSWAF